MREDLFEDTDFLMLYAPELDGVDNPDDQVNQSLGIGEHLRPRNWFTPFGSADFSSVRPVLTNRSSRRRSTSQLAVRAEHQVSRQGRQLLRIAE